AEYRSVAAVGFHTRLVTEAVNRADLNTDHTAVEAGEVGPAAHRVQFVLVDAAPPHLLFAERPTGTAAHAEQAVFAVVADAEVRGLVGFQLSVHADHRPALAWPKLGRDRHAVRAQLGKPGGDGVRHELDGHVEGDAGHTAIAERANVLGQLERGLARGDVRFEIRLWTLEGGRFVHQLAVHLHAEDDGGIVGEGPVIACADEPAIDEGEAAQGETERAGIAADRLLKLGRLYLPATNAA